MKKWIALTLMLALAAAPALAQRDETVYALLDATGAPRTVDVGVRVDGPAGEYAETGRYTAVEPLSGAADISCADGVVRLTLDGENAAYFSGAMEGAELPWTVAVTTQGVELGASGRAEVSVKVAPNPACEEPWFAENLALQMTLSVNLDEAAILDCPGAMKTVTGSTAMLVWMALPGSSIDARLTLETRCFTLGEIQIAGVAMDIGAMLGSFDLAPLIQGGEQLTQGMDALAEGLNAFEITPQQKIMLNALANMQSEDGGVQLVQVMLRQFLPALDGLDEMKAGVGQLSEGLNQYVNGVNGAVESLAAPPTTPRSFGGAEHTDSVQFVLRVPAQAPAPAERETAPAEESSNLWERILRLFGG